MIASLRGKLIFSDASSVVIECGGVGFKCTVTQNTLSGLPDEGEEIFLYTHFAVREDAMELFGFLSSDELAVFRLITSVNGVGPKIAVAMLSEFTPSQLSLYIASEDAKSLTAASGVGIKLAQRIVLELKDKVAGKTAYSADDFKPARKPQNDAASEAVEALVSLGYTKGEASLAVGKIDGDLPADELIKQALKLLARRM